VSPLPAWPSADLLLVNLDLTLPTRGRNRAMRRQERCRWLLTAHPGSQARPGRPAWRQAADKLRAAIRSAELAPGDAHPSAPELHQLQGIKPGTVRHAFLALAEQQVTPLPQVRQATVGHLHPRTLSALAVRPQRHSTVQLLRVTAELADWADTFPTSC